MPRTLQYLERVSQMKPHSTQLQWNQVWKVKLRMNLITLENAHGMKQFEDLKTNVKRHGKTKRNFAEVNLKFPGI